jgi:hypothetical protein
MDSARFSRGEFAFLIGVPLAWALLLLVHPTGEGDESDRRIILHLAAGEDSDVEEVDESS